MHKLQKRRLLIAINCVAGLSIFFFGYDQGMMGGVNNAVNYYQDTMKFGHQSKDGSPFIDNALLQGGIVRQPIFATRPSLINQLGLDLLSWDARWLSRWRLLR